MSAKVAKPRYRFCWVCSRQIRGNYFSEVPIDGFNRVVHKHCAKGFPPPFRNADQFYAADAHGSCPEEEE